MALKLKAKTIIWWAHTKISIGGKGALDEAQTKEIISDSPRPTTVFIQNPLNLTFEYLKLWFKKSLVEGV